MAKSDECALCESDSQFRWRVEELEKKTNSLEEELERKTKELSQRLEDFNNKVTYTLVTAIFSLLGIIATYLKT